MSSRSHRRAWRGGALGVALMLGAGAALAQPAAPALDPAAMAVVGRMAATIAAAPALRVAGEIAWDVVQADGQTLEFGATREVSMRRPDRLRVDLALREGGERRLFYDGKRVVLHDPVHGVYAAAERSGSVAEVAAFVGRRLGVPVPLAELFSPDVANELRARIDAASLVGAVTLDGVPCDHVALRNESAGMQLWVGKQDALPRRVSITYEREEGRPQFRARFADWDLSPRVSDSTFAFEPPKGAEKIAFAVPQAAAPEGGAR